MKTFSKSKIIYLDNHATTPMDPRVLNAMLPFFVHRFANAASFTHTLGRDAAERVEAARREVAALIGAKPQEITFTSGGTESNNLAIKGVAEALRKKGNHLITVATEHKSILDPMKRLAQSGFRVTVLGVDRVGQVRLEEFKHALTPQTILVSVMLANNEIGTIAPLADIAKIVHRFVGANGRSPLLHTDAVQAVGKIPVDVRSLGIDLLSLSAHKLYGPKGVGALFVRKSGTRVPILPLFDGGAQETGLRSGTLNVPGIVGLGAACRVAQKQLKAEGTRLCRLRDELQQSLLAVPGAEVYGDLQSRLPHNLNISFPAMSASELMSRLPGIAFSSGSACLSSSVEPSYVLKAIGVSEGRRRNAVRFGLGRFNTSAEIREAKQALLKVLIG